jgi:amino acid adenylation domain-containing protein
MQPAPTSQSNKTEPIAIVGAGCRFPGAPDLDAFWQLLVDGKCATGKIPAERLALTGKASTGIHAASGFAGLIDRIAEFDRGFFGISPREARLMDPQQRMLMEVSWEALEHAGISAQALENTDAGVFVGISTFDYSRIQDQEALREAHVGTGNALSIAANRLSYFFNLHGPSIAVDTACSSSLVALHLAVEHLRNQDGKLAMVGGVNAILDLGFNDTLSEAGMLSPEGKCKTFDESADGYVRSEGCGVIILKRQSDALADGDRILATIMATGTNQDGRSNGITAPNGPAQRQLLERIYSSPQLGGRKPDYIESHGTGTPLGDPIEFHALEETLQSIAGKDGADCLIGSVKTNVGHLEAAAGIAGVIKTALAIYHRTIPASLHFTHPNPQLGYENSRLKVCASLTPWPSGGAAEDVLPIAGVSSFGFGGTNAHVVLGGLSPADKGLADDFGKSPLPFILSAHCHQSLLEKMADLRGFLVSKPSLPLPSIAATLAHRRSHLGHRFVCIADSQADLVDLLAEDGLDHPETWAGERRPAGPPPLVFVFSGQGSHVPGMGKSLCEAFPELRPLLLEYAGVVRAWNGPDILFELGLGDSLPENHFPSQPAMVAYQILLARFLEKMGIIPEAVTGHSLGEISAACIAGALTPEEALRLAVLRDEAMSGTRGKGRMLALLMATEEAQSHLEGWRNDIAIAAENGPEASVVSGTVGEIEQLVTKLPAHSYIPLDGGQAFHSPAMDKPSEKLTASLAWLTPGECVIPFFSCCESEELNGSQLAAEYWARQLRNRVLFRQTVSLLQTQGFGSYVEIGGRPVLENALISSLGDQSPDVLGSASRTHGTFESIARLGSALFVQGHPIEWKPLVPSRHAPVTLPSYPWQSEHLWSARKDKVEARGGSGGAVEATEREQKQNQLMNRDAILNDLRHSVAKITGSHPDEIDPQAPFIEMGADSILLAQAAHGIQNRYGVSINLRQFFEELSNLETLTDFLMEHGQTIQPGPSKTLSANVQTAGGDLQSILNRQLDLLTDVMNQQMELLGGRGPTARTPSPAKTRQAPNKAWQAQQNFGPYRPAKAINRHGQLTTAQQTHIDELVARLDTKLARSKERAAAARLRFADCRASAGFRPSIKEMLYPVEIKTAQGSHLSDIDGNRYIDISMDFGVNLFGHQPEFLVKAWRGQIEKGLSLSGRSPHASDVAELVCELTGMERCAFCQSGTEAVMVAARLARLSTGRSRIAYFVNSYHGHFDGFLALPGADGSSPVPAAPGIPEEILGNALVLEYGSPEGLETLRREAGSLAAILVEPVQSRHPDLQPGDFLRELRGIADESGALLIFDEMITGFRIHSGGAQAYFDVRADLATYGKVLGGGQPIAAVAGRSGIMDGLDGGQWQYGDSSFPAAETTFVAGTFTGNPLALASADALLTQIKQQGPGLYKSLNAKAKEFADALNDWFEEEAIPLRIARFGSLFRFSFTGNLDLLFYHLLEKGIFIWEGRNCFLSTAHSREDLQAISQAVKDSCEQLRVHGFIESKSVAKSSGPEEETKTIPATEAQRQLWMLAQMDQLANCAYSESLLIQAEGRLDADLLRQALAKVVERHESLRTTFSDDGRQQLIHRSIATPLHTADGSTLIGAEQEAAKEAFLDEVARQPFDLKNGPLVRMGLFRLSRDTQLIAIAGHHIIFDGWSLNLLINDIAIFYSAELGQSPYPDEPAPQFSEYVEWLAETLSSPEIEQQAKFWNEKLKLPLPKLELPHDRRPPAKWSWDGARLSERISQSLRQDLDALGRGSGATLFMTLLSAYQSYLHRLTAQDDLLVGSPVLGRSMPGSMSTIGYLTHILPIQSHFSAGESFKTFLSRQKHDLLDILDNQMLPFANLLRQSELVWNPGEPALIHATFNLDRPREGVRLHGLKCDLLSPPIQAAKFEISVNITDLGGELLLELDYNTNLLSRELAVTIRDGLINWLRKICAQPDWPLGQLSLGDRPQTKKLPMENEFPGAFNVDSIAQVFSQVANDHHNEEAVVAARGVDGNAEEQTLSYAELDWRSDALAARLAGEGIGAGKVVGIGCCRGIERVVGMLGIVKAGAAYLPIDPSLPDKRIELIMAQAQCALVLAESNRLERWDSLELTVLPVLQELPKAMPSLPQVTRDSLAYVMFTSGSTGIPKGVAVSHGNILSLMSSLHLKGNAPEGPVLHHSPASFDVSTFEIWWPLLTGRKLVIAPPGALSLRELAGTIENYSIADTFISTGIFNRLVVHECEALAKMERVIVGGSALSPQYCRLFFDACPDTILENGYGPTEATVFTTVHTLSRKDVEGDSVPIGKTLPNFQGYVLDQHLQALPVNLPGELCLSGPGVAKGYYRRPELTEQAFIQNPFSTDPESKIYKTGDIVKLRPDGTMEYLGRRDQQIKLRGIRMELGEIEAGLRSHPDVLDAIAKVVEIDDGEARLLAWLVVKDKTPAPGQLESWLAGFLPDHMIPNQFLTIDQIPLNTNGKPDRSQLTAQLEAQTIQPNPEDENWTEMEGKIRHLWEDILKCNMPSRSSHFFRSGGHSLLLTEMVAEVTRNFSVPLTLREAMDNPTISQFATLVEGKLADGTRDSSIPRVSRSSRRTAGETTPST